VVYVRRYEQAPIINGGKQFGTTTVASAIRKAVQSGRLAHRLSVLQGNERLDIIAGRELTDARNWWIIAAASGIGWSLQVPPGTRLIIPTDLSQVIELMATL
jgi:hypothetical protein